jgi:hypothetical protein
MQRVHFVLHVTEKGTAAARISIGQAVKVYRDFVLFINTVLPHMERRPERLVFMIRGLHYHSYRLPRQHLA